MASKENVEKVVKAPRIPTVRNFCIGSFDIENKLKLSIMILIFILEQLPLYMVFQLMKYKKIKGISENHQKS